MDTIKRQWWKIPKLIRQTLVLVVGVLVNIVGIILLPLPGPGWLIIFLGFAILAVEFERADKVKQFIMGYVKKLTNAAKSSSGPKKRRDGS